MWFLNPFFWLGVAAIGAPILVHLVRRTRARRIEFPALTFVRQVPQRTIRRRTFRNRLLLILRCLAILLIVIAFVIGFATLVGGAAAVTFVERGAEAVRTLRRNLEATRLSDRATIAAAKSSTTRRSIAFTGSSGRSMTMRATPEASAGTNVTDRT